MARRGVRRTRDEMEEEAVAPVVRAEAAARGEVATGTVGAVRPVAMRNDAVARVSDTRTLDSLVKEELLEDCGGLDDMSPRDFLMTHFGRAVGYLTASMSDFIANPSFFLKDEALRTLVTDSEPYREYELYKTMREGADRLRAMGVIGLRRWESAVATNEVEGGDVHVKGKLNAALLSARHN
ncbi:unnamed protein product [Trypanosoma congolense IL3000]|uniref:WGS project CAEQ00000000 data, annotated contig 1391 n=1 Tax=Trypanosoma congolense (strain IL3000) TaxID=1068625 RepID=F9W5W5_TRYCI|nr:unnamed protein product [Trypanosoma congolense IL3000]